MLVFVIALKRRFLLDHQFYHKTIKMEVCGTPHCHMERWSCVLLSVLVGHKHMGKVALKTEE